MKIISIFMCLLLLGGVEGNDGKPEILMTQDRDIYEHLDRTSEELNEAIDGLTEEQMIFHPGPDSWSIAQVVEHINTVEGALYGMLQNKFKEDETPSMRSELKMSDEQILGFISDRSEKMKTQAQFEPTAEFATSEEALEAFNEQRDEIVDFLKDSNVNMRNYINEFPFGKVDAHQTVLFMSGHTHRHIQQIEEIKQSSGFPRD
ncbi:DinB family protein [Gramella sp. GC03-9]|uniref:DinB family protein n=1 Tax=Christiangramia oceanisediminis TaxID=2920386 RepID=A0A9X2RA70_9FLAO|nr:DinB family protein [Gramella oceanisediminis]MCP9200394.1 DinB family protein [Gramella oceanisediminis]